MLHIELKNYRAFPDSSPARWTLDDGFTSFIGVNNAGKSSLLRFFHELRPLLGQIGPTVTGNFHKALQNPERFSIQSVGDQSEIFSNLNSRDMTITFRIDPSPEHESGPVPSALEIEVLRDCSGYTARLSTEGNAVPFVGWHEDGPILVVAGEQTRFDFEPYQRAIGALTHSVYLGPFRNAINVGTRSDYFDLQIGEAFIGQWDAYKTGGSKDNARSALAVEQEIARIFGMASFQMNATPNNQGASTDRG